MFKKLKGLFVEEDETNQSRKKNPSSSAKKEPVIASPEENPAAYVPAATMGKANDKFMDVLFAAMDKHNLDGFDYLEFKQALKSLSKLPMDEEMRFKSAFASAQTMGATPSQLVKAAHHYLSILKQEDAKFQQALKAQISKQVGNKEQQLKDTNAMIQNKQKQIEQLSKQIEQHKAKMEKMKTEISNSTTKVEATKNSFVASYNLVVQQIQGDIKKMETYLK